MGVFCGGAPNLHSREGGFNVVPTNFCPFRPEEVHLRGGVLGYLYNFWGHQTFYDFNCGIGQKGPHEENNSLWELRP